MKPGLPIARSRFFCGGGGFVDDQQAFGIATKCGQRAYERGLQLVPLQLNNLLHMRDGEYLRRELYRHVAQYVKWRHRIGRALSTHFYDHAYLRRGLNGRIYTKVSYDVEGEVAMLMGSCDSPHEINNFLFRNPETLHDHR